MFESLKSSVGTVDIVINCAGVMYFTLTKNMRWDDWEQTIDVNCKGTVNSCGAALPYLLEKKAGHIVNISSDAARQTFPALTVYNASKTFVHEYSKGLRCELVGTGVRVTELQPGDVRTDLIVQNSDKEAAEKVGVAIGSKIGGEEFDESTRNSYLDAADIASAVKYAITAPGHVGVNEILIEPRDQMYGDPTSMGA
jgi:NADP-dependent 3-hydroxy acid dehydrogenase YdfG